LSVAWFLQEAGFDVTVYDRREVAAGASAGNAGWICPAMVTPLPEPSVLRYGLASVFRPNSPLRIAPTDLAATGPFLAAFALHCTSRQWRAGVSSYAQLNGLALESYEVLAESGVMASIEDTAMIIAFERSDQAGRLWHELQAVADTGVNFTVEELSEADLRREQPLLGRRARHGLRIGGQKFLQPLEFVRSLASAVTNRGGTLVPGAEVHAVASRTGGIARLDVRGAHMPGAAADFDVCVLANGAWISRLARATGARTPVLAGRGYSFTVRTPEPLGQPLYLPALRVACTPDPGGMRVAGTMEFRKPDDPLDDRRIAAILRSAEDFMPAVDWSAHSGAWVGSRPVTADGLPIIGRTRSASIFVAGGHGMWGMTLGPATGRLLADLIATGNCPQALMPFDPLR
jgi:D-amino-acid dehydrogenase